MKSRLFSNILMLFLSLIVTVSAFAQTYDVDPALVYGASPADPGDGGGTGSGEDPMGTMNEPGDGEEQIPVDGGLSLLLAAGAAYGGRRLYRQGAKWRSK